MQLARRLLSTLVDIPPLPRNSPNLYPKHGEKGRLGIMRTTTSDSTVPLVVVAMSGGVDSSVTAALLTQAVSIYTLETLILCRGQ